MFKWWGRCWWVLVKGLTISHNVDHHFDSLNFVSWIQTLYINIFKLHTSQLPKPETWTMRHTSPQSLQQLQQWHSVMLQPSEEIEDVMATSIWCASWMQTNPAPGWSDYGRRKPEDFWGHILFGQWTWFFLGPHAAWAIKMKMNLPP